MFKGKIIGGKLRSVAGYVMSKGASCYNLAKPAAAECGDGWQMWDWSKYNLVVSLLTLICKSTDICACFGNGYLQAAAWNDPEKPFITNSSNGGRFDGVISDYAHPVKTFHVENFWCLRVDALEGAHKISYRFKYRNIRPYNDFSVYTDLCEAVDEGYIKDAYYGDYGVFPKSTGGSATTYYCSYIGSGGRAGNPSCPLHIGSRAEYYGGAYSLSCWQTSGFSRYYIGGSPVYNATHTTE
jgi:hypothetical protein